MSETTKKRGRSKKTDTTDSSGDKAVEEKSEQVNQENKDDVQKEVTFNNAPAEHQGNFNRFGLRTGVNYIFNDLGLVNWKAMIPSEFITISQNYLKEREISPDELDEEKENELKKSLGDEHLVILLSGFKYLANLRGIVDVSYEVLESSSEHVSVKCRVVFRPNYENGGLNMSVQGLANASINNTNWPFDKFLESIAENRAFIRAVRNALNINIVGYDEVEGVVSEMSPNNSQYVEDNSTPTTQAALKKYIKDKNKTFEDLLNTMRKREWRVDESWKKFEDLPDSVATEIFGKIMSKNES